MKLDFIDIRRAYFYAKAKRDVYIKLPDEDAQEGMCGKLDLSMYGTRAAAGLDGLNNIMGCGRAPSIR